MTKENCLDKNNSIQSIDKAYTEKNHPTYVPINNKLCLSVIILYLPAAVEQVMVMVVAMAMLGFGPVLFRNLTTPRKCFDPVGRLSKQQ